jgi:hypothetical protein
MRKLDEQITHENQIPGRHHRAKILGLSGT